MCAILNQDADVCLSGGAEGADQQWGMVAGQAGHKVIHWSFEGHTTHVPDQEVVVLTQQLLNQADGPCKKANETLKRIYPPRNIYTKNLLRRNWFQVRDAQSLYAITGFDNKKMVQGGTAWAIQMFLDLGKTSAYVFSQETGEWFTWNNEWKVTEDVPRPVGIWAGIGSRKLQENGKNAIRKLFNY